MKHFFLLLLLSFCFSKQITAHPIIIAHAAGKGIWIPNSLSGVKNSVKAGVKVIEIDVQTTRDEIPVLYHAADLSVLTTGIGPVSNYTLKELQKFYFLKDKAQTISTLNQVLRTFPKIHFIIDMKSLPAKDLVRALLNHIHPKDFKRLTFYSTNSDHIDLLTLQKPEADVFEKRDITRKRILNFLNQDQCSVPSEKNWFGFELIRKMSVKETLRLGGGETTLNIYAWNPKTVQCFYDISSLQSKLVFFGINDQASFLKAKKLGAYGVYVDNPLLFIHE